jgi:alkylation response protein AidB-like acyl-CoA dehydrogenase
LARRDHRAQCRVRRGFAAKARSRWRLAAQWHQDFTTNGTVRIPHHRGRHDPARQAVARAFVVDTKTPGFSVGRKLDKFSIHCSDTAELVFDNVFVPDDHKLGNDQSSGFVNAYQSLTVDRIFTAALALGTGRAAYDAALRYAKERSQFGQPIGKFQAVQFKLVDMLAKLEQARLYTYHACALADAERPITTEAALAKIIAGDGCNESARWRCRSSAVTAS